MTQNYRWLYPYKCVIQVTFTDFRFFYTFVFSFVDSTMIDPDTPRMLRACYLYALYEELCQNRGEEQGRILCSKVLQVCSTN